MLNANELRKQNKIADEKIQEAIKIQNNIIIRANECGCTRTCFLYDTSQYCDEIKEYYIKKGYIFKPTGVVGGVFQDTIDICW